jgi:hypothetical protein
MTFRKGLCPQPSSGNPVSGFLKRKGRQRSIGHGPKVGARWRIVMSICVLQQCNKFSLFASLLTDLQKTDGRS